ncbi:hypothetical protein T492DRAFT_1142727 [Pavlovales sp. CCMP2436]|nr:hypothetical protein T492DRAFT_1142727 [Pavlovales sp. CCMP2436]
MHNAYNYISTHGRRTFNFTIIIIRILMVRALAAVGAAAVPGGAWRAPSPPRPFRATVPLASAGGASPGAARSGGGRRAKAARLSSPARGSGSAARGGRAKEVVRAPSIDLGLGGGGEAAGGAEQAGAEQVPSDGLAAARACAHEREAEARGGVLGSLLHSARALQLSAPLEEVALALELCMRRLEGRAA